MKSRFFFKRILMTAWYIYIINCLSTKTMIAAELVKCIWLSWLMFDYFAADLHSSCRITKSGLVQMSSWMRGERVLSSYLEWLWQTRTVWRIRITSSKSVQLLRPSAGREWRLLRAARVRAVPVRPRIDLCAGPWRTSQLFRTLQARLIAWLLTDLSKISLCKMFCDFIDIIKGSIRQRYF